LGVRRLAMRSETGSALVGVLLAGLLSTGCNTLIVGDEDIALDGAAVQTGNKAIPGSPDNVAGPMLAVNCAYTPTTVGVAEKQQLPATLKYDGFVMGSDNMGVVHATDMYDCNGTKGIHAIVYDLSKFF
jgi:hypothetical protein